MSGPFSDQGIAPPEIIAAPSDHKPMTVVQLVDAERIGGAEYAAMEVSRAVIARGGRALIGASGAVGPRVRVAGAETFAIQTDISTLRRGRSVSHLVEALRGLEVDVIHARSAATAVIGRAAAEALGARFVATLHNAPAGAWLKGAGAKALKAADRVIAVSDDLASRVEAPNLTAIPRGADMDVFAEEVVSAERTIKLAERWGLAEDTRPIILAPGRLDPSNGHDALIEALRLARAHRPDLEFVCLVVGAGEDAYAAKLEKAIIDAGLAGVARLVGDTDDMAAALKISAVIVSAATTPPAAGRTMIEAQAMGRPVIAPDHGAMIEVVAHGETGWLTPPGDPAALAEAMAAALSMDESQRAHIGMAGRARVRARFTLEAMLGAILGVYEDVTGRAFTAPYE